MEELHLIRTSKFQRKQTSLMRCYTVKQINAPLVRQHSQDKVFLLCCCLMSLQHTISFSWFVLGFDMEPKPVKRVKIDTGDPVLITNPRLAFVVWMVVFVKGKETLKYYAPIYPLQNFRIKIIICCHSVKGSVPFIDSLQYIFQSTLNSVTLCYEGMQFFWDPHSYFTLLCWLWSEHWFVH